METREDLIFASDAIFTFSTRFVTRYCNKSYNFRKNRYFHSPRLEITSIQLSCLYQLSSLERKIKFSAFWKLNFSKQAATIVTLPFPRERSVRGPFDRPPIAPDDDVALSNHFPRIIPDNPRQIVTYLEQFRSPSLAKLLRWGDEYCFLTVSSIRYNSRPRGIAPSAR